MTQLLLVALFLEVGFVLLVVPWSPFWERNYFAQLYPSLQAFMANNFVRGAVSGIGVINIVAGLVDLVSLIVSRRHDQRTSVTPSSLARD